MHTSGPSSGRDGAAGGQLSPAPQHPAEHKGRPPTPSPQPPVPHSALRAGVETPAAERISWPGQLPSKRKYIHKNRWRPIMNLWDNSGEEQRNLGEARMHRTGASLRNPIRRFISVAYFKSKQQKNENISSLSPYRRKG